METPKGHENKLYPLLYEFIGTAILCTAVLTSAGSGVAVCFTLFIILILTGPVSGGHINPAVTMAVFFERCQFGKDFIFMLLTLVA